MAPDLVSHGLSTEAGCRSTEPRLRCGVVVAVVERFWSPAGAVLESSEGHTGAVLEPCNVTSQSKPNPFIVHTFKLSLIKLQINNKKYSYFGFCHLKRPDSFC